ncbi:MAG: hypothetical protein ACC682_16305 [Gemmatimonadota bacterium]
MKTMLRSLTLVLVGFALGGCGDSATGPDGPSNAPPSVAGSWTYAATNMTGSLSGVTVVCNFRNVPIMLTQSGTSFSGTTNGGSFTCAVGGVSDGGTFGSRIVVNGRLDGSTVQFDFDSPDWHHSGSITGNSMTGSATAIFELSTGAVVLRGNWSAVR